MSRLAFHVTSSKFNSKQQLIIDWNDCALQRKSKKKRKNDLSIGYGDVRNLVLDEAPSGSLTNSRPALYPKLYEMEKKEEEDLHSFYAAVNCCFHIEALSLSPPPSPSYLCV